MTPQRGRGGCDRIIRRPDRDHVTSHTHTDTHTSSSVPRNVQGVAQPRSSRSECSSRLSQIRGIKNEGEESDLQSVSGIILFDAGRVSADAESKILWKGTFPSAKHHTAPLTPCGVREWFSVMILIYFFYVLSQIPDPMGLAPHPTRSRSAPCDRGPLPGLVTPS